MMFTLFILKYFFFSLLISSCPARLGASPIHLKFTLIIVCTLARSLADSPYLSTHQYLLSISHTLESIDNLPKRKEWCTFTGKFNSSSFPHCVKASVDSSNIFSLSLSACYFSVNCTSVFFVMLRTLFNKRLTISKLRPKQW